jgi:hypothetical protein
MSILQSAVAGALATIRAVSGVSVSIQRGTQTSQLVQAGVGHTEYEVEQQSGPLSTGFFETWKSRDYLIAAADYNFGGAPVTPQSGDKICEQIAGVWKTYTVMAPKGKQVFEYSDRHRTSLRVHTKETA